MGSLVNEAPTMLNFGEGSDHFGSKVCSLTMQLCQEAVSMTRYCDLQVTW